MKPISSIKNGHGMPCRTVRTRAYNRSAAKAQPGGGGFFSGWQAGNFTPSGMVGFHGLRGTGSSKDRPVPTTAETMTTRWALIPASARIDSDARLTPKAAAPAAMPAG